MRMSRFAFRNSCPFVAFAALGAVLPAAAQAYVGPGAGLTAIGTVIALLAAVIFAVVGFVWYPVKRMMNRRRAAGAAPGSDHAETAPRERGE